MNAVLIHPPELTHLRKHSTFARIDQNLTDKEREARLSFVDSDPSCAEAYMFICDSDPNDCELTQEYLRITTKQAELASLANWSPTLGARPSIERFCPDFVQTLS